MRSQSDVSERQIRMLVGDSRGRPVRETESQKGGSPQEQGRRCDALENRPSGNRPKFVLRVRHHLQGDGMTGEMLAIIAPEVLRGWPRASV